MQFDLLAIGEVMAEIRTETTGAFKIGFAGDTYNTAVYCARGLNQPRRVSYWTSIGSDPLSAAFMSEAESEELDLSFVRKDKDRNIGLYAVSTDTAGERSFSYWRKDSAARRMFQDPADLPALPASRIVYLSGITLAILSPACRRSLMDKLRLISATGQSLIAFDSNYRPHLWESADTARACLSDMWDIADIALPSIDDEMALFNDASEMAVCDRFAQKAWAACAIKRSARGPIAPGREPEQHPIFSPVTHVVDTTAAGDSFNGAYLAAFLLGRSEAECLLAGHQLASRVVCHKGAIIPRKTV